MSLKNVLVITTGTRDVQLNIKSFNKDLIEWNEAFSHVSLITEPKNIIHTYKSSEFPDSLAIVNPRSDGEKVFQNLEWDQFLCFPIIENSLDFFLKSNKSIHYILIVITNQNLCVPQSRTDTLFFGQIIKRFICKKLNLKYDPAPIEFLEIKDDVTDPDTLYPFMEKAAPGLFNLPVQEIEKVYLLAQGGIDQINQTLTLQLIRFFRNKVIQLQKAEGKEVKQLLFPELFLNDLTREQLRKHINDFNFELVTPDLTGNDEILNLAEFADKRLGLDYDARFQYPCVKTDWLPDNTIECRLKDLYLSAKIHFRRKVYAVYLWKLFTLSENILHPFINRLFETNIDNLYDKNFKNDQENPEWINKLKQFDGLYEKLKKDKILLNNPNRVAFIKILSYLSKKGKLDETTKQKFEEVHKICKSLNTLNNKRNDIAHYLRPLRSSDIEEGFSNGKRIEDLNLEIDRYFGLDGPEDFGVYNAIQERLLEIS